MDQYSNNPGGSANMPPFGSEPAALDTAADHQLPSAGETGGSLSGSAAGASTTTGMGTGGARGKLEELGDQIEDAANEQMRRTAEQLDSAADQIDRFTAERTRGATGVKAQAGSMAHSVADMMESAAGYLRDNDVDSLRENLRRQMRERPLQTLLVGVAAGWVVGKILR
jgi:hypothetical protein